MTGNLRKKKSSVRTRTRRRTCGDRLHDTAASQGMPGTAPPLEMRKGRV